MRWFALWLAACGTPPVEVADHPVERHPEFNCAGGCASHGKDYVGELDEASWLDMRDRLAQHEPGAQSQAMDELVFYGPRALEWLERTGPGPLSGAQETALRRELAHEDVDIEFRLLADSGEVVGTAARDAPIGVKQHVELGDTRLGHTEVNGTVVRVGLHHLWSRW